MLYALLNILIKLIWEILKVLVKYDC